MPRSCAVQEELQHVSEALRQATKQLCRNLKDSPNVSANLEKVACERQALQLLLANVLEELHETQTIEAVVAWGLAAEHAQVTGLWCCQGHNAYDMDWPHNPVSMDVHSITSIQGLATAELQMDLAHVPVITQCIRQSHKTIHGAEHVLHCVLA